MAKNWRTLRVLVEIKVPEDTFTEKDWKWTIDLLTCNAGLSLKRNYPLTPVGRTRVVSYSKFLAAEKARGK